MRTNYPVSHPVILASQSPRRRELLASTGLRFEVIVPNASAEPDDAAPVEGESTAQFVQRLAIQKAIDVASRVPYPALVIGCDTVADLDGQILGKPKDRADAQRMLRSLSGRKHSVWSGMCIVESSSLKRYSGSAESRLDMQPLTDLQLADYLDSGDWQGKSGAFGYQDGHTWLTITSGTSNNVVGLPLDLLAQLLQLAQQHLQTQSQPEA